MSPQQRARFFRAKGKFRCSGVSSQGKTFGSNRCFSSQSKTTKPLPKQVMFTSSFGLAKEQVKAEPDTPVTPQGG